VEEIRFEQQLPSEAGFVADAVLGDTVFEVLSRVKGLRNVRSSLFQLARFASLRPSNRAVLVFDEPGITRERLEQEWESACAVFRGELAERLSFVIARDGEFDEFPRPLPPREREALPEIIRRERGTRSRAQNRRGEAFYDVLRVLLVLWFRQEGPVTSKRLMEMCRCSYPTIASSLKRIGTCLKRHSDRSVELSSFPREAWFKLVAGSEQIRATRKFSDRSARPRSPESLLSRLQKLDGEGVAIGGIEGARHYQPSLDLVGTPRIDLVVHVTGARFDLPGMVRKLDPALKPAEGGEPVALAVHQLLRPASLFSAAANDPPYADEVECLLDLQDARLESQALEFLDSLTKKARS